MSTSLPPPRPHSPSTPRSESPGRIGELEILGIIREMCTRPNFTTTGIPEILDVIRSPIIDINDIVQDLERLLGRINYNLDELSPGHQSTLEGIILRCDIKFDLAREMAEKATRIIEEAAPEGVIPAVHRDEMVEIRKLMEVVGKKIEEMNRKLEYQQERVQIARRRFAHRMLEGVLYILIQCLVDVFCAVLICLFDLRVLTTILHLIILAIQDRLLPSRRPLSLCKKETWIAVVGAYLFVLAWRGLFA